MVGTTVFFGFFIPTYTTYFSPVCARVLRLSEIFTAPLGVTGGGFHAVTCETQDLGPKWRGGNAGGSYMRLHLAKFCVSRKNASHEG